MRLRLTALAAAIVLLTGCSTMKDINKQSLSDYSHAQTQLNSQFANFEKGPAPVVDMADLPYVNTTAIKHDDSYPASFYQAATVNIPSQRLWVLLKQVESLSGIAVQADHDLLNDSASVGGALPPMPSGGMDSTLSPPSTGSGAFGGRTGPNARAFIGPLAFQGSVKGLLDTIAGNLDATWSYDSNARSIHFYRYETRSFHIATTPGDASSDSAVASGDSQGVQGGAGQTTKITGSKTNTAFTTKVSVWDALQNTVKPMLSTQGTLSVSQPTAAITVHDRWDRVSAIAKYVTEFNTSLTMQVEVNVTVYRVSATDGDSRGINWGVLYNQIGNAAKNAGLAISTARPAATGLSSLVLSAPLQRSDGSTAPFAGSKFFLDALSTLGKTSVVTNASVNTVNNTPAPLKVVQSTAYVAQTTSLLTSATNTGSSGVVGAGATLTPGTVETGFTMQVLPSVQPDGQRLLLQAAISLSTLDSLPSFSSGGETIQLPQVSAREFLEHVWMKSGQALVLAGFQNTETDNTTQSPLSSNMWLLGGNRTVNRAHDAIVIVITPTASSPQTSL